MKFRLKLFVLFFLLVSVALGSVAFFSVRVNADGPVYVEGYSPKASSRKYNGEHYYGLSVCYSCLNPNNKPGLWKSSTSGDDFSFSNDSDKYVDAYGLHLINQSLTLNNTSIATFQQGQGFAIELVIGDFIPGDGGTGTYKRSNLFSLMSSSSGAKFSIAVTEANDYKICIGCQHDSNTNLFRSGTWHAGSDDNDKYFDKKLKNSVLSVSFDCAQNKLDVYLNGELIHTLSNTQHIKHFANSGLDSIQLGDSGSWKCSINYKAIRTYSCPITAQDVENNYKLDKELYFGAAPATKNSYSYGVTGLNKILEKAKSGTTNIEEKGLLYKQAINVDSSYTETFTNKSGKYELSNELLEDWELSNNLQLTVQEKAAIDAYQTEYTRERADEYISDNTENVRASFVNVGALQTDRVINDNLRTPVHYGKLTHKLSSSVPEYRKTTNEAEDNAALYIENSFFMRSKYKCGSGELKFVGNDPDFDNSTKLMVTADFCTQTLNDTDFCGIVIDYSDEIYNKYSPDSLTMYSDIAKDSNTNNRKLKITGGDTGSFADHEPGYTVALFPTGVGFNLLRKSHAYSTDTGSENPAGHDNNDGYVMRVFVGGTDNKSATYTDIENIFGAGSEFHNITVYRSYEKWTYDTVPVYNLSNGTMDITKDNSTVYMVKFYVDKKPVAMIAMEVHSTYHTCLKNRGGIFKMVEQEDGSFKPVLDYYDQSGHRYTASTTNKKGQVKTFGDWSYENLYGKNGKLLTQAQTLGDTGAFDGSEGNNHLYNIGTPSGNVLVAVKKGNENLDGDEYFIAPWYHNDGDKSHAWHKQTENDFCKIFIDNIGYMDYHDKRTSDTESLKTKDSFMGQLVLSESMTFNFDTLMNYTWPTEPKILFNRLCYLTTDDMRILKGVDEFSNLDDYKTYLKANGIAENNIQDYLASHGYAQIKNTAKRNDDDKMDQHFRAVDGVFFKDLYDLITYRFVDFNGESMFDTQYRVFDYVQKLYTYYDTTEGADTDNQNNGYLYGKSDTTYETAKSGAYRYLLRGLVDFCQIMQKYSGYDKYSEAIPYLKNGEGNDLSNLDILNFTETQKANKNFGTTPLIKNAPEGYTYSNKIMSANVGLKNYVTLIFKVQIDDENFDISKINEYIEVYEAVNDGEDESGFVKFKKTTKKIDFVTDPNVINSYSSYTNQSKVSTVVEDSINGTVHTLYIEIPINFINFSSKYNVILKEPGNVTYTTEVFYSVYDYCFKKWDNTSTSYLSDLVKRMKNLGNIAYHLPKTRENLYLEA